jgi:hypothetical protein
LLGAVKAPTSVTRIGLGEWDALLREARASNLLARLATSLEAAGMLGAVPEPVRPHMVAAIRLSRHQHDAIQWECRHLERALQRVPAPVVLLKGAAYAMCGLQASRGRLFGDIDLLVSRSAIVQAEAGLREWGWSAGTLDPYDDRYYRRWMHELPPMAHRQRGTTVDLHHNILPLTAPNAPDASRILQECRPLEGSALFVPSTCDLVIHSAVHLFHEGEAAHSLRDLLDLQALVTEFGGQEPAFWRSLCDRARDLDLAWPVCLALRYLRIVLEVEVPAPIEAELQAATGWGRPRLRLLDALYLRVFLADATAAQDAATSLAMALLYLRGHALRMPTHLLAMHLSRKALLRLVKSTSRN